MRRARQYGLGITVHTGEAGPVEEVARVIELLEPDRIGHGVKAAYDPRAMACSASAASSSRSARPRTSTRGVVSGWDEFRWIFDQLHRNGVRYAISTDGPEMLKTYIRDELATLGRLGILDVDQQQQAAATSIAASFVPNVSDVPRPRREPATRESSSARRRSRPSTARGASPHPGGILGGWTSTSRPITFSCATRSATSWKRRSRPSSTSTSANAASRSRSSAASASWAGSGSTSRSDEGGAGMDTLAYAIAVEEISRVWGSLGIIVAAHTCLGCGPLHHRGQRRAADRYLRRSPRAQVIGAYGLTEPRRRLRRRRHADDGPPRGRPDGDSWVIDGAQALHHQRGPGRDVHHHRADRRRPTRATPRSRAFIVPADTPGLLASAGSRTRWASTRRPPGELQFDGVRVPAGEPAGRAGRRASGRS